eukprot:3941956-Rhodomonas_salina.1
MLLLRDLRYLHSVHTYEFAAHTRYLESAPRPMHRLCRSRYAPSALTYRISLCRMRVRYWPCWRMAGTEAVGSA